MGKQDRENILESDLDLNQEIADLIKEIKQPKPIQENILSESDARIYIGERMECCGNDDSIYDFKTELDSTFISCNFGDERPVT